MDQRFIPYKKSTVAYRRSGRGGRVMLCFHGYGENAASFDFLSRYAGEEFLFLAIDLPFHGQTRWEEGLSIHPSDLSAIIQLLFEQESVPFHEPGFRYTLTGYSLGGRICLSLYQQQPAMVDKLLLLAPDGLKVNAWYWLATQTHIGNRFFAFTMKKPYWFFGVLKLMNRFGLINSSIFKFVNYYIGDPQVRKELYNRWTTLRYFKPDVKTIRKQIPEHKTAVRLLYGIHDRIIKAATGKKFITGIEQQSGLQEIHSGHMLLHEKHVKEILPALLH